MGVRLRCDPDLAGSGPGPARARRHRLGGVQRVVDAALHAVFDVAGRAVDRTGCRSASSWSPAATPMSGCSRRGCGSKRRLGRENRYERPRAIDCRRGGGRSQPAHLTAEALTRACLERARAGAEIKAWAWLDPEQALAQARASTAHGRKGRCAAFRSGSKTSSTPSTCRPSTGRRSIPAVGRLPTRLASL